MEGRTEWRLATSYVVVGRSNIGRDGEGVVWWCDPWQEVFARPPDDGGADESMNLRLRIVQATQLLHLFVSSRLLLRLKDFAINIFLYSALFFPFSSMPINNATTGGR